MPESRDIPLTNLLLDHENPRLAEGQSTQLDTLQAMLRAEGPKTLALAGTIAKEGLSPLERLLVIASEADQQSFIVLEGNRRLTALKILAEPGLAEGVLTNAQHRRIGAAAGAYHRKGEIELVPCVVFSTRDEANPWIERRHRGDQGGEGIVRWGATEAARFDARRSGKRAPELQVLDLVTQKAPLDTATRDRLHEVSITNLKRLIRDKAVRDALGVHLEVDGSLTTMYPIEEVVKGLGKLVRDLAHERVKVKDIYTAADRQRYLGGFRRADLPAKGSVLAGRQPLIGDSAGGSAGPGSAKGKRHTRSTKPRSTLIPSTCGLNVPQARLNDIFRELRRLKLEDYPNAIAVLLRVFLELSVDEVVSKDGLMVGEEYKNAKLSKKMQRVATHLETKQRLLAKQAQAVRKAASDQHLLYSSVTTFHTYVHNQYTPASPTELRAAWDTLQPLFEAIWV
jgi:hypothetical protein